MRIVIAICFIFLLLGCRNKNSIPKGIIAEEDMRSITEDMMKADQFFINYIFNKDTSSNKEIKRFKLYQQVLDIHHVSKEQFKKSFLYYKSNSVYLGELMDSIQKSLLPVVIPPEEKIKRKSNLKDSIMSIE